MVNSQTSAPTSPHAAPKSVQALLSRAQSITGQVTASVQQLQQRVQTAAAGLDNRRVLLVIDDQSTDWCKYFGRDVRVEQCLWSEFAVSATVDGAVIQRGIRNFRPDALLVRQPANEQHAQLLGLRLGGILSVNPLQALYNMQDRPWLLAHLMDIRRRVGADNFPLVHVQFAHKDLTVSRFPAIVKVGKKQHALGSLRVDNEKDWQDVIGMVSSARAFCTVEPLIDARCDVIVQKFGSLYRTYLRKSVSGHWKVNTGSCVLEATATSGRQKMWVDEVSACFGGLDVCAVYAVQAKDGREWIIGAEGSTLALIGDSQEEDRRLIAEIIERKLRAVVAKEVMPTMEANEVQNPAVERRTSGERRTSIEKTTAPAERRSSGGVRAALERRISGTANPGEKTGEEGETDDTMKNLRRTFAGIFGDM